MEPYQIITLLTDFGLRDGFIGVMKGVMRQIAPGVQFIDMSHELPHYSIIAAAFLNERTFSYFPTGSVHLCVVDPGVGTSRRMLVMETRGHRFVAPDNGLLTPLFDTEEKVEIISADNPRYWLEKISNTFHGRDIFSPLAAHLARGVNLHDLGQPITDPVRIPYPYPKITDDQIQCTIVYIDQFGNCVTNLDQNTFNHWLHSHSYLYSRIQIRWETGQLVGLSHSYGEKEIGDVVAVFDGFDHLELAVNNDSASRKLSLELGSSISITPV